MYWVKRVGIIGILGTIATIVLRAIFRTPFRLAEDAIEGWINRQIGNELGVVEPTVSQVVSFFAEWGPPIVVVLVLVVLGMILRPFILSSKSAVADNAIGNSQTDQPALTGEAGDTERDTAESRFEAADLDQWRRVDPLLIWQAGCLWKRVSPQYPVTFNNPAYGAFSMLMRAAEHDELDIKKSSPRGLAFSQVTRTELAKYAIKKNDNPEFLDDILPDITKESEYISLHEAATRAYEETEGTVVSKFAEMTLPSGKKAVLSWYARALIGKNGDIPVFGKNQPSKNRRHIPDSEISQCDFSDDVRSLTRLGGKIPKFVELEIKKSDFENRLEKIKNWNGAGQIKP